MGGQSGDNQCPGATSWARPGAMLDERRDHDRPNEKTRAPVASDSEETIYGLVAKQARGYPKRIAIIDGETEIDFQRLMARANEIAGELAARGVAPGSLVGVCMSRTWELVATLAGVLRARCAYVPLDPAYPQERVRYMLEHSRAAAAIVENEHTATLCEGVGELIWLDEARDQTAAGLEEPSPTDLAYVIYTSGSTGRPKGVAVEQRNLVAMSHAMGKLLNDEELEGVLAAASVCFDTSVMETLGSLSLGGTIVLADHALELPKLPSADKVRTCVMVPSSMQALLSSEKLPENIRCVVFGGEALKLSLVNQVHALEWRPRVVNAYGPTEDSVFSTTSEVPTGTKVVTIGRSVPNSRSYILDDSMQPVPVGVPGELYLAGDKLARGYLYDEAQTKERFVAVEPNGAIPETRMYRTGDLCQWRENGEIEFLGRVDQQVKIRGFRIELGEIESTLESMQGVDAAAAAALDGGVGQKILVIYVVSQDEAVTDEAVKAYLAKRLPKYMVPQLVMHLEELPLLPNDKLDRNRLPSLEEVHRSAESRADAGVAAVGDASGPVHRLTGTKEARHAVMVSIIQGEVASLLDMNDPKRVLPNLPFDSFGLDSLTTPELSSRLTKALGRKLPAEAIFDHATPEALADYILSLMGSTTNQGSERKVSSIDLDSLAHFQSHFQSSHPTFQAAKAPAWSATDKGKLVQEVMRMVNDSRRNPYSKVIRTGSASRGTVTDAYTDEEQEAIIWTTNLYLGLNRDKKVIEESRTALENFGTGMGTSAAASGLTDLHLAFETEFADLVGKPGACLFPTGYTANVGVIAGLLGKNDVVVLDQLCHASIVDGARLCGATIRTFKHDDAEDLATVLEAEVSPYRTVLVVLEGVYSMGEGAAPVAEIVRTAKRYGALVLVDEAHSFGFYGPRGAGICADQGVTEQVDFIMTTLSKALGSLGGIVAARKEHVDLLKSSARAYIFQASISPADMAAALTALRRLSTDDTLCARLWDTTRYMRARFTEAGYDLGTGDGPIVTPHFSDKDKLYAIVQGMYERGVQTSAVTYPIVESGRGRLRLICSASHTREDVDKTLAALIEAEREVDQQLTTTHMDAADVHQGLSDVEDWANAFSAYVKQSMAKDGWPAPDLAVSIQLPDDEAPITFMIDEQVVTLRAQIVPEIPTCSLQLTNGQAISALCSSNVQALLRSICQGTCVLNGQVEPFIWLIGRMVDRQRDANAFDVSQPC
ncbi:Amino acid adenylation domain-containing protein [Sulfidibacter corallicola]|uniref:Amino acid adenylation domain-containing protein n=1 Tax=Sulfidibacter corallicola TaxID=2818388 RepID=A0A8A4TY25_SULCO|nr:amino acid adenylation domain-containing protein [Sulfidibacter corallicola]QTD54237.1 amino acid adenylation domain-containing protein [Sulfidibacter corallicola]